MGERKNSSIPEIERHVLGPWETNCYVVRAIDSPSCWIVDAGFDPESMIDSIRRRSLQPARLILTHAHLDHIGGVRTIVDAFPGLPILIHEAESEWLGDPALNLSTFVDMDVTAPEATELLQDGESLRLGDQEWRVIHTPGHSPGGITLVHDPSHQAIVGDTLFAGSIGRYDFPTSNGPQLIASIQGRLMSFPDETKVYPGHGPDTTIGHERRSNPFIRGGLM